jgi:L-alanine-DL-glutamate epimerase-like enolase superfamily enzyme
VTAPRAAVHPLALPSGEGVRRCLVLVLEAGGFRGLGEAADRPGVLDELLAGRPASPAARAAWAAARLDLEARAAGVSVAALLRGGRSPARSRVRCARRVSVASPARVAREVEAGVAAGFRTFDLVACAGGDALDLERLGAARWAAGAAGVLRLDADGALSERARHSLAAFRVELVAAIDPASAGGPAAAFELASASDGPAVVRSDAATWVGRAAALHVACALETEPADCAFLAPGPFDPDVARGPVAPEPAWLALPHGPGLGVELDPRSLARYRADR